jgi:hypothetical protein
MDGLYLICKKRKITLTAILIHDNLTLTLMITLMLIKIRRVSSRIFVGFLLLECQLKVKLLEGEVN